MGDRYRGQVLETWYWGTDIGDRFWRQVLGDRYWEQVLETGIGDKKFEFSQEESSAFVEVGLGP